MSLRSRWLAPALILLVIVFGLAIYSRLPASVPTHWNARGESDGTMPRLAAVLAPPLIALGLWALLLGLPRLDPRNRGFASFLPTYWLIVNLTIVFLAAVQVLVLVNALGWKIEIARIVPIGVGVLFIGIGNELGRVRPNWLVGIRTPWTLSSDEVWRRTHRVGGRWFVAAGFVIVLASLSLPVAFVFPVFIAVALALALGLIAYSWYLYQHLAP